MYGFFVVVLCVLSVVIKGEVSTQNSPSGTQFTETSNLGANTWEPTGLLKLVSFWPEEKFSQRIVMNLYEETFQSQIAAHPTIANSTLTEAGKRLIKDIIRESNKPSTNSIYVLVPENQDLYHDAEIYMKYIFKVAPSNMMIFLVKFNLTDITKWPTGPMDQRTFLNSLKWNEKYGSTTGTIEPEYYNGAPLYSVILALPQIPNGSAILAFTDWNIEDPTQLYSSVFVDLHLRNIRLYVVWRGFFPKMHDEALLLDGALSSGGKFLVGNTENITSKYYYSLNLKLPFAPTQDIIAVQHNIFGPKVLEFQVDSSIKAVHISITGTTTTMSLFFPEGQSFNILNTWDVESFSEGSFSTFDENFGRYEIHLNVEDRTPIPIVGLWRLYIGSTELPVNVTVSANTKLRVKSRFRDELDDYVLYQENHRTRDTNVLKLDLPGQFTRVKNITFLDMSGFPFDKEVPFKMLATEQEDLALSSDDINTTTQEISLDVKDFPINYGFLRIEAEDIHGNNFSRLSYFDRENVNYMRPPLTVEVGLGSELLVMPNQQSKIFFEVTNNRDRVMYMSFRCQDEKSHLADMQPRTSYLNPRQTVVVTVTTYSRFMLSGSYRNIITFTASGPERAEKRAAMHVSTTPVVDKEKPRMWHRYTSSCSDVIFGKCEDGTWSVEVTAEDRESGLLQLTSNPKGLYIAESYISGTTDSITGRYAGSCCQPELQVTAVDLNNNVRTFEVDASHILFSAGTIVAVILGILLLILILILLIWVCRKKCCKEKSSVDLPTYRGPDTSSRGDLDDRHEDTRF